MTNDYKNGFDSSIHEIEKEMTDLEDTIEEAKKTVNDDSKVLLDEIMGKTKTVMKAAYEESKRAYENIKDSDKVNSFMSDMKEKSIYLINESKKVVKNIQENENVNQAFDKTKEVIHDVASSVKKNVTSNEDFMNFYHSALETSEKALALAKDGLDSFLKKPEVNDKIVAAKKATVNSAKKVAEALEDWLQEDKKD